MLHRSSEARKHAIEATDGSIGVVDDYLFDDRDWSIRYVVVDTHRWLPGRKVLVPRAAVGQLDEDEGSLAVALTRAEIEDGPGIACDPPLSSKARAQYYGSYLWTSYPWGGYVGAAPTSATGESTPRKVTPAPRTSVRSAREIEGYRIEARDGRIGHVEDLVVDSTDWTVPHLVLDTRNWLPGKHVVVPPSVITAMDWKDEVASVRLTRDQVRSSPEFDLENLTALASLRARVVG